MILLIAITAGTIIIILCRLIEDILFGDTGRKKQISGYFSYLKGKQEKVVHTSREYKNIFINNKIPAKKYFLYAMPVCMLIFIITLISFKSLYMAFIISLFGFIYPKVVYDNAVNKKKTLMSLQLRDALNSIINSLKAGLSINSALVKCMHDLETIYTSIKEKPMLEEFKKINHDLSMGTSVDNALNNFSKRLKMEDVDDFVNSVVIVRLKGGNLVEVMDNTVKMINDKISIKREIDILTTGKKMEAKIISTIPIFIIVSLSILSPGYMKPLYSSGPGKVLIILGLIMLTVNYFVGRRIVDIHV